MAYSLSPVQAMRLRCTALRHCEAPGLPDLWHRSPRGKNSLFPWRSSAIPAWQCSRTRDHHLSLPNPAEPTPKSPGWPTEAATWAPNANQQHLSKPATGTSTLVVTDTVTWRQAGLHTRDWCGLGTFPPVSVEAGAWPEPQLQLSRTEAAGQSSISAASRSDQHPAYWQLPRTTSQSVKVKNK